MFLDERLTHHVIALIESTSLGRWPTNLQKRRAGDEDDEVVEVMEVVEDVDDVGGVMPDGAAGAR